LAAFWSPAIALEISLANLLFISLLFWLWSRSHC